MNRLMIRCAVAASLALSAGVIQAQEMGTASEQPTVVEQLDPDKGQEVINDAESKRGQLNEEQAALQEKFVPAEQAVRTMLRKQLKLREGYDPKRKSFIAVGEAEISVPDPSDSKAEFMNIRAMKALEAYQSAKVEIIRAINNDVSGVDRVACMNEFGQDDIMKVYAEKKAAFEAKKIELAKALSVLDEREADALAGVTISDRFCAILDGIAKKLDSTYNKEQIAAEKREAYEEVKAKVAELKDEYAVLEKDVGSIPKYPKTDIKNEVKMLSKQPILGAYTLLQAESWDKTDKSYKVAMAVVWSPKLEANAVRIMQGDITPATKKGSASVEDWIDQQYLPCMIGSRRITDEEGHTVYIGIGAEDISGPVIDRKARRALADTDAIQAVARSLFSDLDTYREASRNLKEYADGLAGNKAKLAEVAFSKHDVNLKGCSRLTATECIHPITGRKTYVSVYYLDPYLNKDAVALMKSAYASAGLAVKATQYARGVHAGQQAALEGVRKSSESFSKGYKEGKKTVDDEMAKRDPTNRPLKKAQSVGATGSKKEQSSKGNGGTFSGDANVDTDF